MAQVVSDTTDAT